MFPLVDLHCHLLAGLDDGPRTQHDAVEMCRMAAAEGVQLIAAVAHQNERWPAVTPSRIRASHRALVLALRQAGLAVTAFPGAEVAVQPHVATAWQNRELLSLADRKQYLLIEMPHGTFVDLRATVRDLRASGLRPILAHPERHPELLHEPGTIERLIELGALVQVSSGSVTDPASPRDEKALRSWFRRGVVHVIGSDGHSPVRRAPRMAAAYARILRWAGVKTADHVCSSNGMAILNGRPLRIPRPRAPRTLWTFLRRSRFWAPYET